MSDYVFSYTSTPQTNVSFVVKPYTANGPANPASSSLYNNATSGIFAVSANTPLVLVGKGAIDYGQAVQNNLIYLTENFCNRSRPIPPLKGMLWYKPDAYVDTQYPSDPIDAGLYIWNGSAWKPLVINGTTLASLDANGQRIINLADAIAQTDALNLRSADGRYLQLSGGTLVGNLTMGGTTTLTLSGNPTAAHHASTKSYVDAADSVLQTNITDNFTTLSGDIAAVQNMFNNYLPLTGGTVTGTISTSGSIIMGANASLSLTGGGSGTVDIGQRRVQEVGDPVGAYDAANKSYVDNTIATAIASIPPSGGTSDGVVSSGAFNESTGVLTLTRTAGLPPVTITGAFAAQTHTHEAAEVGYDIRTNKGQGILNSIAVGVGVPLNTASVSSALTMLDQAAYFSQLDPVREIQLADGVTTTFTLDARHQYEVWSDRLVVHVNGVKYYGDFRSHADLTIEDALNGLGLNTTMTLTPGTYPQTFTIDGTPHTMNITIASGDSYWDMIVKIANAIDTLVVPMAMLVEQLYTGIWLSFVCLNTGPAHTMAVSYSVGDLFTSIVESTAPISEVGQLFGYSEDGVPGDVSTQITFHQAPPTGSLIEFTILR